MLLMRFATDFEAATVPDPYYGGQDGFNKVMDYIEDACQGVLRAGSQACAQLPRCLSG